ncbi:hypothetical protein EYF80_066901 [Liparis tanakae]|uniref:Uncharacterized protein n=1 Tax=Liparis tanakae TaxID=230148 RepID=A0A4Z2E2U3_9TELE|nr:hypothetical protein EYF80_066901 [Liparis tanakae]
MSPCLHVSRTQSGFVSSASLQSSLIALSAETLLVKYRALVGLVESGSGSVSRSRLGSLLQDLSQVKGAYTTFPSMHVSCTARPCPGSCGRAGGRRVRRRGGGRELLLRRDVDSSWRTRVVMAAERAPSVAVVTHSVPPVRQSERQPRRPLPHLQDTPLQRAQVSTVQSERLSVK